MARAEAVTGVAASGTVELQELSVAYGGFRAVDGVSLTVARGERVAVIGPNGAGKTTMFKAVSGEVLPSSGAVLFDGRDISRMPAFRRARLGIARTFQVTNLFPRLTVAESIQVALMATSSERWRAWWPVRSGGAVGERVRTLAERVRLGDRLDATTSEMSHGEQRQLEIALALAGSPRLLLLDEPAAGLTAAERGALRNLISELPAEMSVMLIEHDVEMALGLVDRVLCLADGAPVALAEPDRIRQDPNVQAVYLKGVGC